MIDVLAWAWDQKIEPVHKLVLLACADGGDPGGDGPPPTTESAPNWIAERCGLHPAQVIYIVHELVEQGLLVAQGRYWDGTE